MFKQVKSAMFWYYLYKFRKRVLLIALLLIIALFANAIYSDIVEYLKLKDKLEYLEVLLIGKWIIIIFNMVFSIYLMLTMFKKEKEIEEEKSSKSSKKSQPKTNNSEKFSNREKEFLYKKKLRSDADILLDK